MTAKKPYLCLLPAALGLAALAGCVLPQYGTYTRDVDILGGQTYTAVFNMQEGPVPSEDGQMKIGYTGPRPAPDGVRSTYSLTEKSGQAPQRITVEDVTGASPLLLADDRHPKLNKDKLWVWNSPPIKRTDAYIQWVLEPDETIRVYRYTVVAADGRSDSLLQAEIYPPMTKDAIKHRLGMDAPPPKDTTSDVPEG